MLSKSYPVQFIQLTVRFFSLFLDFLILFVIISDNSEFQGFFWSFIVQFSRFRSPLFSQAFQPSVRDSLFIISLSFTLVN